MASNRITTTPPVTTASPRPIDTATAPPAGPNQQAVNDAVGQLTSTMVASDSRKPAPTSGTSTTAPAPVNTTPAAAPPSGTQTTTSAPAPATATAPAPSPYQQPVNQVPPPAEAPPPAGIPEGWTPPSYGLPPFKMPQIGTDLSSSGGFEEPFGGKKEKTEEEEAEEAEKGGPSPF